MSLKDKKLFSELREHLGLASIKNCIRRGTLKWFRHAQRYSTSDDSVEEKCRDLVVVGQLRKGRVW